MYFAYLFWFAFLMYKKHAVRTFSEESSFKEIGRKRV